MFTQQEKEEILQIEYELKHMSHTHKPKYKERARQQNSCEHGYKLARNFDVYKEL